MLKRGWLFEIWRKQHWFGTKNENITRQRRKGFKWTREFEESRLCARQTWTRIHHARMQSSFSTRSLKRNLVWSVTRARLMTGGGYHLLASDRLWRARSRLYQRRFLRPNTHFSAFFEIYKICNPLHRSKLNKFRKFLCISSVCVPTPD